MRSEDDPGLCRFKRIITKMEGEGHQVNEICTVPLPPTKKVKCVDDLKKWEESEAYQVSATTKLPAGCTMCTTY